MTGYDNQLNEYVAHLKKYLQHEIESALKKGDNLRDPSIVRDVRLQAFLDHIGTVKPSKNNEIRLFYANNNNCHYVAVLAILGWESTVLSPLLVSNELDKDYAAPLNGVVRNKDIMQAISEARYHLGPILDDISQNIEVNNDELRALRNITALFVVRDENDIEKYNRDIHDAQETMDELLYSIGYVPPIRPLGTTGVESYRILVTKEDSKFYKSYKSFMISRKFEINASAENSLTALSFGEQGPNPQWMDLVGFDASGFHFECLGALLYSPGHWFAMVRKEKKTYLVDNMYSAKLVTSVAMETESDGTHMVIFNGGHKYRMTSIIYEVSLRA